MADRPLFVHFLPDLVPQGSLSGATAVVIDVLRATTSMIAALSAGCVAVIPCVEIEEARKVAGEWASGKVLLAGERGSKPIDGFDFGNSPREFTPNRCRNATLVMTTSNGTRALLRATEATRVLVAAFVNYSAVCEQLRLEDRPVHIICAGSEGDPSLEDTLLAGALVDFLCDQAEVTLNDSARIAWDTFENHGRVLEGAFKISKGGARLMDLGFEKDIEFAARVDRLAFAPEMRGNPPRIELGTVGIVQRHWPR